MFTKKGKEWLAKKLLNCVQKLLKEREPIKRFLFYFLEMEIFVYQIWQNQHFNSLKQCQIWYTFFYSKKWKIFPYQIWHCRIWYTFFYSKKWKIFPYQIWHCRIWYLVISGNLYLCIFFAFLYIFFWMVKLVKISGRLRPAKIYHFW